MSLNLIIINSDLCLAPVWCQAIIRTNISLLLIKTLWTIFREISIKNTCTTIWYKNLLVECLQNCGHFVSTSKCLSCLISHTCTVYGQHVCQNTSITMEIISNQQHSVINYFESWWPNEVSKTVIINSDNGFLLDNSKWLPRPMMTYL